MNSASFPRLGETSGGIPREIVMVMERGEEGKNFHGVSPFLVEKVIQSYCGEVVEVKKSRDGKILVTVKNDKQGKSLEKISKYGITDGISVKVYEHKTLNYSKVIVFSHDLKNENDAELSGKLANQGIVEVNQIRKGKDKDSTPTGIFVLKVRGMVPPKKVKIGYLVLETRPWYPNPLRCFVCLKFGHVGKKLYQ